MKIHDCKQLGTTVRARRKELGVTQKQLAMVCGSGLRFIVDLEKGKPTCRMGMVLQVIQALGLEMRIVKGLAVMIQLTAHETHE